MYYDYSAAFDHAAMFERAAIIILPLLLICLAIEAMSSNSSAEKKEQPPPKPVSKKDPFIEDAVARNISQVMNARSVSTGNSKKQDKGGQSMPIVRWYWGMTHGQRVLCWLVSLASIVVFGLGILPTVILFYGHLGKENYIKDTYMK